MLFAEDNVSVFRSSFSDDIADGEDDSPDGADNEENKVDLKALADEVYNLMKKELKQERERLGTKR